MCLHSVKNLWLVNRSNSDSVQTERTKSHLRLAIVGIKFLPTLSLTAYATMDVVKTHNRVLGTVRSKGGPMAESTVLLCYGTGRPSMADDMTAGKILLEARGLLKPLDHDQDHPRKTLTRQIDFDKMDVYQDGKRCRFYE